MYEGRFVSLLPKKSTFIMKPPVFAAAILDFACRHVVVFRLKMSGSYRILKLKFKMVTKGIHKQ